MQQRDLGAGQAVLLSVQQLAGLIELVKGDLLRVWICLFRISEVCGSLQDGQRREELEAAAPPPKTHKDQSSTHLELRPRLDGERDPAPPPVGAADNAVVCAERRRRQAPAEARLAECLEAARVEGVRQSVFEEREQAAGPVEDAWADSVVCVLVFRVCCGGWCFVVLSARSCAHPHATHTCATRSQAHIPHARATHTTKAHPCWPGS